MISHHTSHDQVKHHPLWLEIIRIGVAGVIFWKGLEFVGNIHLFTKMMMESSLGFAILLSLLVHLIIAAHILGALALFTGTYVKVACIMQMPVILMALLFRDLAQTFLNPYAALSVSVVILAALVLLVISDKHDLANKSSMKKTN